VRTVSLCECDYVSDSVGVMCASVTCEKSVCMRPCESDCVSECM
jgi:hypothetical protein